MADERPGLGYTYPNISDDPERQDVLRNKLGLRSHSELATTEYRLTTSRLVEIRNGAGPQGEFDAAHLKAIHQHIFQDVYEWAGYTRNQTPVVDGERTQPVMGMRKGGNAFLPGSRIDVGLAEALKPIRDPQELRGASAARFIAVSARVLGELNYVHPFREGNGRAQEAFITELGRRYGHCVDFSVITRPRMIEASKATLSDPAHPAMQHLMEDAVDPARTAALRSVFTQIEATGENPIQHNVRTARIGEVLSGTLLGPDAKFAGVITAAGIVAVRAVDLPTFGADEVTLTVRSGFDPEAPSAPYRDNIAHTPMRARLERFREARAAEAQSSTTASNGPSTEPGSHPAPSRGPSYGPGP